MEFNDTLQRRVEALLARMTLAEKVAQMIQIPYNTISKAEAEAWAQRGAGSFFHALGEDADGLQQIALHTRLRIPILFGIDAIHGHALNPRATVFPSQLAMACTWNRALVEKMGRDTACEVAADGLHWTFSPVLCLARDPRWGRVDETFGEDPCLTGELGAAIIRGYQGGDLAKDDSILACAKHFIGYGEAVGARDACDTEITSRKMREVFLPPFRKAVEAGCATFMTAYGSIDGTPLTASQKILDALLRKEMGFSGILVTDYDNVNSLITRQRVAKDIDEAVYLAATASNDMIMNTPAFYDAAIKLVKEGRLSERIIDNAVYHILSVKFRMGLFKHPEKKENRKSIGCEAHMETALSLARESVVLLRNRNLLPLSGNVRKIAVIGPNADDIQTQYGDWTYFTHPDPAPQRTAVRPYATLLEGMRTLAEKRNVQVVYHHGCGICAEPSDDLSGAVKAASGADVIILALGDDIRQTGESKDRADLALSGRQSELLDTLFQLGIPIAVVLNSSKPLCFGSTVDRADAVLVAFNGGMFGGQAIAEILFGVQAPQGRLPISFPRHSGQVPVYYNGLPGWHGGRYCDLPETPQFVFGEGLSYTHFSYKIDCFEQEKWQLTISVTNDGPSDGIETVQVYFQDCISSIMTPGKRLIAFEKVALKTGETRTVFFQLSPEDFSLINNSEERVTEPGEFILMVGHSSKDEDLVQLHFINHRKYYLA